MYKFILGLILLAIPFIFLSLFENKKRGFVYVLFSIFLFLAGLSFFTQLFSIFYYWLIIAVIVLADIILLFFYYKNSKKLIFSFKNIDWVLIFIIFVSAFTLYHIHYNYTGKINLATDQTVSYHEVKNMEYVYPYFSDEWYAVSLVKSSIDSRSLPLKNLDNTFFHNLEVFFHSFMAGVMLVLNLDPLTQYAALSLAMNVLMICLAYIFLRINNVSKLLSGIASSSILYITCGANFPGLWHFIPMSLGVIFCLMGFCFISLDALIMSGLALLMVLLFYPPLAIFYGLGFLIFLLQKFYKDKKKAFKNIGYSLMCLAFGLPVLFLILMISPFSFVANVIISKFYYLSFSGFNIPQYAFYNIIPPAVSLAGFLGLPFIFKNKKWLFWQIMLCLLFWFFYSLSAYRVVIEYERAVFFASILICLASGFGLDALESYFIKKIKNIKPFLKYAEIGMLVLFLALAPFYTQRSNWQKLVLINSATGAVSVPKSPANNYLTEEDVEIFKDIKNQKFLSIPWKGTVIGVATDNYPVITKEGTISLGKESDAFAFLTANCLEKTKFIEDNPISYVYMYDFDCPGFEKINESKEGFVLFKVIK